MTFTHQGGPYPQSSVSPDVIELGLGQPSPKLLPIDDLARAAATSLRGADPLLLQYGTVPGYLGFREALARFLTATYRHPHHAADLLVTGGISSALSLCGQVLARSGDTVVCGDPTYFLARGIFETQGLDVVGVPVDRFGLDVEILRARLESGLRPAFVYLQPSFHNPCGVDLAPARAEALVELAERFDFVLVADEPYVALHFGPAPPPCLAQYDRGRARVLSLGSFSKILGPGLRLGWAHAAPPLLERIAAHGALRSGGGLNPVIAAIVHPLLDDGFLVRHVEALRETFAARSRALTQALRDALPQIAFDAPRGGYFLWLDLGPGLDARALREYALEHHAVGFTPGSRCAVHRDLARWARLSFAFYREDELAEGVHRLAAALAGFSAGSSGS